MYIVYLEKVMDNSTVYYGSFEKEKDAINFCKKNEWIHQIFNTI